MQPSWVHRIRRLCSSHKVSFFFKQWGGVQKSKAGRILNGKTYDDMPPRPVASVPSPHERLAALQVCRERIAKWRSPILPNRKFQAAGACT